MNNSVKHDRLKFKIGSCGRMNFFGLPVAFIVLGIINLYFIFITEVREKQIVFIIGFIGCLTIGVLMYLLQLYRLRYKSFKLNRDLKDFKDDLRDILIRNDWEIDYDNNKFMQATYRGSVINHDMLTFWFTKKEIRWNVIRHPWDNNSIAAIFTFNNKGKRIITKIKDMA